MMYVFSLQLKISPIGDVTFSKQEKRYPLLFELHLVMLYIFYFLN